MIHKTNICIRQVFIFKENFILGVVCQDSYTNGHFLKVSLLATFWIVDIGESTFSLAGPAFCREKSRCQIEDSATYLPVGRKGLPRLLSACKLWGIIYTQHSLFL